MSVLVKDINVPSKCTDCRFMVGGWCYAILAEETPKTWPLDKRPTWCPLIPVPPHGRLIDADKIDKKLCENSKRAYGTEEIPEYSAMALVLDYVESAPTVIQAEEG